jgi:hypothetical protein
MALALPLLLAAFVDPQIQPLLERVSEEARVFTEKSPLFLGVEKLTQRGRVAPPRFRLRRGAKQDEAPTIAYRTTELVSEYGFGSWPGLPGQLHEIRSVVSVNGRQIKERAKARLELSEGMSSDMDRLTKQMLQDMEAHGLVGAVSDLGQIVMLFNRARLRDFDFQVLPDTTLDDEAVAVLAYRQTGGDSGRVYHHEMTKVPMSGELWIRRRDGMPMRVTASMPLKEGKYAVIHQMTVTYLPTRQGVLMPSKATYSRTQDSVLMVETEAAYTDFKMFSADTEIKFVTEDDRTQ